VNYCKTCVYRDDGGYCVNQFLCEQPTYLCMPKEPHSTLIYTYNEDGEFYVGDNFGCVHHKEKEA